MESKFISPLLLKTAGVPEEKFLIPRCENSRGGLILGAASLLGALTFFVHPVVYLYLLVALVLFAIFCTFIEAGVLCILFVTPFLGLFEHPTIILGSMLSALIFGYLIKWIRGKRVFDFRITDVPILIFTLLMLCGGIITTGGLTSFQYSLLFCIVLISVFAIVNVIRTA